MNFFYMPGAVLGAYLADMKRLKPRHILGGFFIAQGILGFIMAACYKQLVEPKNVGAFVVVYGIFLAFGEAGPGDNIGLFASKTSATAIRFVLILLRPLLVRLLICCTEVNTMV